MFPIDPDWTGLVWSVAGLLALLALAVWFVRGNHRGRAAIVVALALTLSAATAIAQDWGQISEAAKSQIPTSVSSPVGSALPDAEVSAAFGQIATVAMGPRPETGTAAETPSPDFGGIVRAAFASDAFDDPRFDKLIELTKPQAYGDAAPTPISEVVRVLALLPAPQVGFVDFGCGADARWCVAAAERWKCPVTGIEIDHERVVAARRRVSDLGLSDRVTIIEGDALTAEFEADVGVAYLYSDVLEALRPRLEKLRVFASYLHRPPGLPVTKNGSSWIYVRPVQQPTAVWNGQAYQHPVCNNPGCAMCQSIRSQLATAQPSKPASPQPKVDASAQPAAAPRGLPSPTVRLKRGENTGEIVTVQGGVEAITPPAPPGHYETRSVRRCEYGAFGRVKRCWAEQVQVWVPEPE